MNARQRRGLLARCQRPIVIRLTDIVAAAAVWLLLSIVAGMALRAGLAL